MDLSRPAEVVYGVTTIVVENEFGCDEREKGKTRGKVCRRYVRRKKVESGKPASDSLSDCPAQFTFQYQRRQRLVILIALLLCASEPSSRFLRPTIILSATETFLSP